MLTKSLAQSRFNPKPGILDFWNEIRKPQPYRLPILFISTLPLALIFYWLSSETVYKDPERPQITYITTFDPLRTDAEIAESNRENQEVKDLREQRDAELAERKRDLYKALGAATGMDVEAIEARADAERTREEAAEQARREELFARTRGGVEPGQDAAEGTVNAPGEGASESSAP